MHRRENFAESNGQPCEHESDDRNGDDRENRSEQKYSFTRKQHHTFSLGAWGCAGSIIDSKQHKRTAVRSFDK